MNEDTKLPGARFWSRDADGREARLEVHQRQSGRAVRPRPAATLVLMRRRGAEPEVLMGRRHADLKFMPNKFVFPGGRVDRLDSTLSVPHRLRPEVEARLGARRRPSHARALALAAIRETFEETGVAVAHAAPQAQGLRGALGPWQAFQIADLVPALDALDFIARAITPPQAARRFDAHFFLADADLLPATATPIGPVSGELQSVQWVSLAEAVDLNLPSVTRAVLDTLAMRLQAGDSAAVPVPFFHVRRGRHVIDPL